MPSTKSLAHRYPDFLAEEGCRPHEEYELEALRHAAAQMLEKRIPPQHLDA